MDTDTDTAPRTVMLGLVLFVDEHDSPTLISPDAVLSATSAGVRLRDQHPLTRVWLRGHRRPIALCTDVGSFASTLGITAGPDRHPCAE